MGAGRRPHEPGRSRLGQVVPTHAVELFPPTSCRRHRASVASANSEKGWDVKQNLKYLAMCVPMLVIAAVLMLNGGSVAVLVLAAGCAVMMVVMMRGMGGGGNDDRKTPAGRD